MCLCASDLLSHGIAVGQMFGNLHTAVVHINTAIVPTGDRLCVQYCPAAEAQQDERSASSASDSTELID